MRLCGGLSIKLNPTSGGLVYGGLDVDSGAAEGLELSIPFCRWYMRLTHISTVICLAKFIIGTQCDPSCTLVLVISPSIKSEGNDIFVHYLLAQALTKQMNIFSTFGSVTVIFRNYLHYLRLCAYVRFVLVDFLCFRRVLRRIRAQAQRKPRRHWTNDWRGNHHWNIH
jgi:hypothetical protein